MNRCTLLSGRFAIFARRHKAAGKLLLLLCTLTFSATVYSQSYYYFETKITPANKAPLDYFILLALDNDGSAVARILYKLPGGDESRLVEQKLKDSSADNSIIQKYLVPAGGPAYVQGDDDGSFIGCKFIFKQQTDNKFQFYTPAAIEYADMSSWKTATTSTILQKSFEEMSSQRPMVSLFYSPSDSLYTYLFDPQYQGHQ